MLDFLLDAGLALCLLVSLAAALVALAGAPRPFGRRRRRDPAALTMSRPSRAHPARYRRRGAL